MTSLVRELFKHNLWANLRLLDACEQLADPQLERTVAGTYGSLRDTWVHLIAAEGRYVALLSNQVPDHSFSERTGFSGWADLRERVWHNGERLIDLAENLDASQVLRGMRNGEAYAILSVVPMIQAINHATEHRVHIATILTQLDIEPPTLDGWQYGRDYLPAS